ncbi:protein ALP1-like [Abrus precatorius]|uniref:Protein ALP1-like n=1 Tax=Abrus precatorius TaxID=3816 RepID=A0A8B8K605_ABRPR|nr:protein ALP1-like [Abrus precatorius]
MELGTVPFFTQEDYSHFHNLFQEMDSNSLNNKKKRNRKDDDSGGQNGNNDNNNSNGNFKDILASLILLEEEENREERNRVVESEQHRAMFNASYDYQAQAMDSMAQFQAQYAQLDELDHKTSKRARRSIAAAPASASAFAFASGSVSNESGSGSVQTRSEAVQQRRLWVKDRSKDWWERISRRDFPEEEFRRWFRMSKSTFDMICEELDPAVTKKNTMLRDAIPVRQRVAVCIWRLATGDPLRLVSKRFGLGISTCHKLVLEVCSAIRTVLMPKFLQWPNEEKMKAVKEEFEGISGIPNVGGSMYTTHVPIIAPKISVAAYFNKRHTERNQRTSYSITVQGVVDPKGVFTDVCIGWPGSMADDKVLENSVLYERANRGNLKDVWIVGNSGHPLMDWVMVPYTHQNLTWTQHAFNEKIGDIQSVAKQAFAKLKGRWGCLQKRTEVKLLDLPVVLGACCVLHNICEMRNEEMDPDWMFELFDDEMVPENAIRSASSMQARDHIAHYLLHHGRAGTRFL